MYVFSLDVDPETVIKHTLVGHVWNLKQVS